MSASKQKSILSFFATGESAAKKQKTADEPPKDSSSSSSGEYSRKFQQKWLSTFASWLTYDEEKNKMFCKLCINTKKSNTFTLGTDNFRTSTITRHIASNDHKLSVCSVEHAGDLKRAIDAQLSGKEQAVVAAMKCVYFMVKRGYASSGYKDFVDFMSYMNCPDIDELKCKENASYTSLDIAYEFQDSFAAVIKSAVDEVLSQSPCISILADESTDISVTKKLVVYARAIGRDFVPETIFLENVHVTDGKAETITNALVDLMEKRNINVKSVFGFGSDGATVMTSKKQGVTGRLLNLNPKLINIHCMAHKLALATSQAAENVPYLKEFQEILTSLYYYFKKSAVRNEKLKSIQEILNEPHLRCKEVHAVRWLSFFKALETVYLTWDSLVTYFEQEQSDPAMKGFNKKLTRYEFLSTLHMLMDVMPCVMELCLVFQKKDLDLTLIDPALQACRSDLEKYLSGEMDSLKDTTSKKFLDIMDAEKGSFKGHKVINNNDRAKQHSKSIKCQFIEKLLENLSKRFPQEPENLVSCFTCLGLRPISFLSRDELDTWGNSKMKTLLDHYGADDENSHAFVDKEKSQHEWKLLKSVVLQEQYPRDQFKVLWSLINRHHKDMFPNLIKLAALALTLPVHTADCERGFSMQNQLKTPERNRLSPERLDTLMTIAVQGPDYKEFNYNASMQHWKAQKSRRIFSAAHSDC